jgi:Rrf2 family protein
VEAAPEGVGGGGQGRPRKSTGEYTASALLPGADERRVDPFGIDPFGPGAGFGIRPSAGAVKLDSEVQYRTLGRMQLLASEEYGLRCLLQVARAESGAPVSISQIAGAEGLSPEYTAKLMRELRLGALVDSVRGSEGGYRLARPAAEISVWSALQVLGGEFFGERFCDCHPGQRDRCVRSSDCSLRALWGTVQSALRATLEHISLEDLGRDERAMVTWLDPVTLATHAPRPEETT